MRKRKGTRAAAGDLVIDTVVVLGIKVDVKRRRGTPNLQLECLLEGDGKQHRVRRSAKTTDKQKALENARGMALELVRLVGDTIPQTAEYLVAKGSQLTLGEVFDAYCELRLPLLGRSDVAHLRGIIKRFILVWGSNIPVIDIDQRRIEQYVAARRKGIVAPGLSPRTGRGVKETVVRQDFTWLSTILKYVGGLRHGGRTVLSGNPLHGLRLPSGGSHVLRPVADARRYQLYMLHADVVDAPGPPRHCNGRTRTPPARKGMFRLMLFLARHTGRRIGAIRKLRFTHILRTEEQVREALANAPEHEESWARDWPFGAIAWVSANDKKKYTRITPIGQSVREALDDYIAQNWDGDPNGFLFPSASDPTLCVRRYTVTNWLNYLEEGIRERGITLPKLRQGQFHPFRRMWRSERSGAFDRRLIALVGGWSVETGVAMDDSYQQFTPTAAYLCAAYDPASNGETDSLVPGVLLPGLAQRVLSPEHLKRVLKELRGVDDNSNDTGW